jgi:CheY-like chemotaxis protein/polyhydroxyalkanoate synthesis regulator phasin
MVTDIIESWRILVADDNPKSVNKIQDILVSNGCKNVVGKSKISSLKELEGYELVILDIVWHGSTKPKHQTSNYFGIKAAEYLRQISPSCKIVLMSKYFYELDQLDEINKLSDGFFSSNADSIKIFSKVLKVVSTANDSSSILDRDLFLRDVLLAEEILNEVDGDDTNKPSLIGLSNKVHTALLQNLKIIENKYREKHDFSDIKDSIESISLALHESASTIKTAVLELLKEVKRMSTEPSNNRVINATTYNEFGTINTQNFIQGDYISMSQDMTQAASQIQDLIEQLEKQGKTVDVAQNKVAEDVANQAQNNSTVKEKLIKWGQSLGNETVSDVVKGTVKLAIRLAGIPLP